MRDIERDVEQRYSSAATAADPALCCPTQYDPELLADIPDEVLAIDYGCGDPTRHLRPGETVLDLGSGSGKHCFMASRIVGREGRVIGIDMNDDMLALSRRAAPVFAARVGYANVEFRKGRIQDLALDRGRLDAHLREHPVASEAALAEIVHTVERLRRESPMVADGSVDVVVSNCVLNLVRSADKRALFDEIFRVLRRGGRAVISDITSDKDVPPHMQADPDLWTGCVAGALREDAFLRAFEDAGFYGIELVERAEAPWRTVDDIELRSVTVVAHKGKQGPCDDAGQAVIYRGPFRSVEDDDGHVLRRGERTPVCAKTFEIFSRAPYRDHIEPADVAPDSKRCC